MGGGFAGGVTGKDVVDNIILNPKIRREQPCAHFRQINKLVDSRLFQHADSTHHPQGTVDRCFPGFPIIERHKISVQILGLGVRRAGRGLRRGELHPFVDIREWETVVDGSDTDAA